MNDALARLIRSGTTCKDVKTTIWVERGTALRETGHSGRKPTHVATTPYSNSIWGLHDGMIPLVRVQPGVSKQSRGVNRRDKFCFKVSAQDLKRPFIPFAWPRMVVTVRSIYIRTRAYLRLDSNHPVRYLPSDGVPQILYDTPKSTAFTKHPNMIWNALSSAQRDAAHSIC